MNRIGIMLIACAAALLGATGTGAQVQQGSKLPPPKTPPARAADLPVSLTGQTQLVLERLAEDLRIGARQQKAWDAYTATVVRYADDLARARHAARETPDGSLTAPEQLDRLTDAARNRMAAIEEIVDAARAVYATLGPEQRPAADKGLVLVPLRLLNGGALGNNP